MDHPADATSLPWHAGEIALQREAGVVERMEGVGRRNVRDFMPDQHRAFFATMPFVVAGSVDAAGDAWATLLVGRPGFMTSPSPTLLDVGARRDPGDPAAEGLREGDSVGLLGIELDTRRRNRLNGTIRSARADGLRIEVEQSFGNCPQYIRLRDVEGVEHLDNPSPGTVEASTSLDAGARAAIAAADTFFVASYVERRDPEDEIRRQVDVSHRGGRSGFVRVGDDGTLTIPDFAGNLFFMTLGNIRLNRKTGLVFPDFATGELLQMTGDADVITDSPEIAAFEGAERLWTFRPRRVVRRRRALPLRWAPREDGASPNSLMTGDWHEAADRLRAAELGGRWRPFAIVDVVDESPSIRSFQLRPDDGAGLPRYRAGQHLPIRVALPGSPTPVVRTYTLSGAPSASAYRVSVKRGGLVSNHLHDYVRVGDTIEARGPAGTFTIDARERRPAVLLAGGIGITPLLAMLHHIVGEGLRLRRVRPATLFYATHRAQDRAFDGELARLAEKAGDAVRIVRVVGDAGAGEAKDRDAEAKDGDATGRIDMPLLARFLPFGDYDFFLCGPPRFVQALYDGLRGQNVADDRIHAEAFGPSSLVRDVPKPAKAQGPAVASAPAQVTFAKSARELQWTPSSGSLLDLAEAQGLHPDFSCRAGSCGTCKTKVLAGRVAYLTQPTAEVRDDEALICCAAPAEGGGDLELAL